MSHRNSTAKWQYKLCITNEKKFPQIVFYFGKNSKLNMHASMYAEFRMGQMILRNEKQQTKASTRQFHLIIKQSLDL